ncbi:hypothetical protein [Paenibacillus spongiae]|uniref:DUF3231 family protein n=1 Tax=Paenibacillus spongiae TaxID=2909671 RepID=A0ABY5S0G5_9BACL|nr:hypothetical protein [Paenibacillus spongiae]UVI27332.1 hypothetical protein L1F29_17795 [Paenibacillus spongiae]
MEQQEKAVISFLMHNLWDRAGEMNAHESEDAFVPNFPVFKREPKVRHLAKLPPYEQLQAEMDVFYKSVYAIIGRDVPARLHRQLKFVSGYNMRMMCLRHALEQGHFLLPVESEKSTIAMFMMIG